MLVCVHVLFFVSLNLIMHIITIAITSLNNTVTHSQTSAKGKKNL